MPDLTYRPLTTDDIDAVAALVVRCDELTAAFAPLGWALPAGHAKREIEVWHEDFGTDRFQSEVACDAGGRLLGVVATLGSLADQGTRSGHVVSLFVDPDEHGQGIGAALLARAEAWLRNDGCDRATLNVLEGSPAAGFYEANGWCRDGRTKVYEPFGMPTIGYSKSL